MSDRDMQRLLAIIESALGAAWIDISEWLRDQATVDEIERRLLTGDIAGVIDEVQQAARKFAAEAHQAYTLAGRETATWLDSKISDRLIHFDETNHRVIARARANQLEYVQGLADEQRIKIQRVLYDGARNGTNPREMARTIRDGLGLTPTQDAAVQSYRAALESGDLTNALGRQLRDGRSDRLLVRLRRDGESLTSAQVDSLVERYRSNFVAHRAETIARTEGLRALHEGNEDLYRQAIERGDIDADSLLREWNHGTEDINSRIGHVKMDGQKRKFGEAFENPITGALLRYPGDPQAGPQETIGCACAVSTRLAA
jgi:hypothetical protein